MKKVFKEFEGKLVRIEMSTGALIIGRVSLGTVELEHVEIVDLTGTKRHVAYSKVVEVSEQQPLVESIPAKRSGGGWDGYDDE